MARVFTITKGLENMGALKTGGQGSVYKGKRLGEIITAVKILPTPIYSESGDDKHFTAFRSEVDKLKKVNQVPNPNVVKIVNSGLTDSGNLPFIEMEFIEGPDLEELLKPPKDPIFTLNEVLKVAEQLSNALAHCHKLEVKHGDIKSNNVKFNTQTSNYVLLDFGLAIMSDEQRRSSLRQAGAIEFMAPEQNTGQMLFETDVYSFGVVIFELVAGTVPFPLKGKGESARNEVRLAHMVTPIPDVLQLRRQALPPTWDDRKKEYEMRVPDWLLNMISKCLEKKPAARFASGAELHDYILNNHIHPSKDKEASDKLELLEQENKALLLKQEQLQKQEYVYRRELDAKQQEILRLKAVNDNNTNFFQTKPSVANGVNGNTGRRVVSRNSFTGLLVLTIGLACYVIFSIYKNAVVSGQPSHNPGLKGRTSEQIAGAANQGEQSENINKNQQPAATPQQPQTAGTEQNKPVQTEKGRTAGQKDIQKTEGATDSTTDQDAGMGKSAEATEIENTEEPLQSSDPERIPPENAGTNNNRVIKKYLVASKAWFYNEPNEASKRNIYIGTEEKAVVEAMDERYGFIYVVVKDPQGRAFKGWLRKSDLRLHSIE